jgi:hypothetical protein
MFTILQLKSNSQKIVNQTNKLNSIYGQYGNEKVIREYVESQTMQYKQLYIELFA